MPPPTRVPSELLARPFLLETATRAGISAQIVAGRRFRRLFHSVYVSADMPDSLALRVDAVQLLLHDGAAFSHHTAAALRGLPVPETDQIHVTASDRHRLPDGRGVCPHQATAAVTRHGRHLLTAPAENFIELAATLSLVDLVVLGDAMVRRGFITCDELLAATATTTRRRGVRMARHAAALVRPRVDSPMETRLRLLVVLAGLPEPDTNPTVRDDVGGWIGQVDLAYVSYRIAIEYHGDVHRSKPGRWRSDVAKVELLGQLGWQVIVLTADDVYARPANTLRRVEGALKRAGHLDLPLDLDPAWREHFGHDDQVPQTSHFEAVK